MLTLPSAVRVFAAASPTDLRKSFDGLSLLVASRFGQDLLRGDLFVFFNRRRTQVRVLFWDRTGHCIVAKKLARGTFHLVAEACLACRYGRRSHRRGGACVGEAVKGAAWTNPRGVEPGWRFRNRRREWRRTALVRRGGPLG